MIAIGIDPGLASLGAAVLEQSPDGTVRALRLDVLETKKETGKRAKSLRVADDDQRRMRELWDGLTATAGGHGVTVVGIEAYAPFRAQGGNSWKAGSAYQMAVCWAWAQGREPIVHVPGDLKRKLLGKQSGTKEDVAEALSARVEGFASLLDCIPKTKREHASDAAGHALLAIEEVTRIRRIAGL